MKKKLSPKQVFHYFEELAKIPRCSGNEKQVSDYLVNFAKKRKLAVFQDKKLNVIIKKPGTKGYEDSPAVILQGHMDMVCEKLENSSHDFSKDPISLTVDGDFLRANGTTLGADNGIGVAYGLAILDSDDIPHPPVELLVTTDEETGMYGAASLKANHLIGKTLLNIDAEEEGVFFTSCAGGRISIIEFDTHWMKASGKALLIKISGLKGGHSGLEIIQQRANAIKLLGRILDAARKEGELNISSIAGGSKHNAIASLAQLTIAGEASVLKKIKAIVKDLSVELKKEYAAVDPDLKVTVTSVDTIATQLDTISTQKIIDFLLIAPNGVQSMSMDLENLVESSLNFGVLEQSDKSIRLTISVRSSVNSIREEITCGLEALAKRVNAKSSRTGEYPAWRYEPDSKIRDLCVSVYKEVSGNDAVVRAIHAGLECGLLKEKLSKTDMISFGPNLFNVHTPAEYLSIRSVANMWDFLKAVLAKLK
ncbi:MAG: aminoacyl-histidine dipeptidase [Proteobacteria bacterium]|nr:aminoacyl-histidine dipeptidase [Desulfobacula sp.]MBU3954439.1 aminoacyl-histidine dipeptidase [Pseudomonadota bacterium]MBU4133404.1 aminoacyl-histidine dipeptidase [Pseudomonadota bacterium]